jgi:hypothetical protein
MSKAPIRTQMNSKVPSTTGSSGVYGHNTGPFSKPQSMGNGGIPTKFFDTGIPGTLPKGPKMAGSEGAQRPRGK